MILSLIIDFSPPYCVGLEIYFHHHHSSFFTEPEPLPSYRITTPTTPSMPLSLAGATTVTVNHRYVPPWAAGHRRGTSLSPESSQVSLSLHRFSGVVISLFAISSDSVASRRRNR
ncbi:hypothetical protein F2Q69_00008984 [Brassica cretica]|uniref:Uncharacterized protein n=1 Tax=Brassica cretica TaxID=69181 RepID=A0A8S9NWC3_BRACR|nr:hypothetical protein F2Q69_00008984 [Brassica cretica]